jgi:hypothetical protein
MLPSGSCLVIDPSGLTTEVPAALSAGVISGVGSSFMPGASAGTTASEAVGLGPDVAVPELGSGAVTVTSGWGSADSGGSIVFEVPSAGVAVTESPDAIVVAAVVPSGGGALTDTVPSGWVIIVGPSGLKVNAGIGSGSSMARILVA